MVSILLILMSVSDNNSWNLLVVNNKLCNNEKLVYKVI